MQDKYYELQLKINPDIEDIVSDICFEVFPCEGVVLAEETYKDLEMVSTTEGTLRVFLTEKVDVEPILKEQYNILKSRGMSDADLGSWEYTYTEKANEDWSKKWKEKWDVTHVSDRITIVPEWIEYKQKSEKEVIIRLEPGCAFGTGTHQTTQLCMKAMEKYLKPDMTAADIGMGSGILSICAIKLGAKSAYGCDIDEDVIDVARENALKNNVSDCYFELGTADKINQKFDFVMANILHNVLFDIMGDLKDLLKDDGILSLSGILDEKKDIVLDAVKRENLIVTDEMHQDQWVGFVVKKTLRSIR